MARKLLLLALPMIIAALPVSAAGTPPTSPAPPGTAQTRYCMHIEAITGSRLEKVKCWTRDQWAEQGVDVDQDWPNEGVRTIG